MVEDPGTVTLLLERIRKGERKVVDELVALIYPQLHQKAHLLRRDERAGHSLQTGDLVQEGLVRLLRSDEIAKASNRGELHWAFSRSVRQILVDHARQRTAQKRGGDEWQRVGLDDLRDQVEQKSRSHLLELHEILTLLEKEFPEEEKVLELHYFGNYSLGEISELLGISLTTVERRHRFAKAWLHAKLKAEEPS